MKNEVEQAIEIVREAKNKAHQTDGSTPARIAGQLRAANIIASAINTLADAVRTTDPTSTFDINILEQNILNVLDEEDDIRAV